MGGVSEGEDVLARWSDGLLYLGNVKRVDGVKLCCLVRFEDNSEFWVLRKDLHSFATGLEEVCCVCEAPPLKEPLITCLKCRHGYHPECHTPSISPECDSSSWICRQCVFAVTTKRGGALKRGRFARLLQVMKLRLPYSLSALDWDQQHRTNQQQCYCYCAGPGEWNLKMLQCGGCGQWFHEACTQCLSKPLLYGDRFYQFCCSVCSEGPENLLRLPLTWVDLAHLVLYHLSLCCKRKYFDFDQEILSFTNENWDSLLLGELSDTPTAERCLNLLNALNSHKDRFVSGKEIKKKKCLFGLQVRAPPPLSSDSSPVVSEAAVDSAHRRSPIVSSPCLESRKLKRRILETQVSSPPDSVHHTELLPCCHGYVGGATLYYGKLEEELNRSPGPKRLLALYHATPTGSSAPSRTLHNYRRSPPPCHPYPISPISPISPLSPHHYHKQHHQHHQHHHKQHYQHNHHPQHHQHHQPHAHQHKQPNHQPQQHHQQHHQLQPGQKQLEPYVTLRDVPAAQPGSDGGGGVNGCVMGAGHGGGMISRSWGAGEGVRILARRVTPDGKVQYLVEWDNVNIYCGGVTGDGAQRGN